MFAQRPQSELNPVNVAASGTAPAGGARAGGSATPTRARSVIGNDLKIIGQGLQIISEGYFASRWRGGR